MCTLRAARKAKEPRPGVDGAERRIGGRERRRARAAALKAERGGASRQEGGKAGGDEDVGDGAEGVAAAVDDLSIGDATGRPKASGWWRRCARGWRARVCQNVAGRRD